MWNRYGIPKLAHLEVLSHDEGVRFLGWSQQDKVLRGGIRLDRLSAAKLAVVLSMSCTPEELAEARKELVG